MSKKKGKDTTSLKQEEILTAVVVADDFTNKFYPIDVTKPKCLLPLANKPLLHYTLQCLIKSAVKRIYIYCANCSEEVREYIKNSKWGSPELCGATVTIVPSQDVLSIGDVFRHIDDTNLISHDFIFVPSDVISNASLTSAWEEHKARREKYKDVPLLTVVMKEISPQHNLRMVEDDTHIVHDINTNRIYRYNRLKPADRYSSTLPLSILKKPDARVMLNYSMTDTGIWICSPKVSQIFADNFDYTTPVDFIKGVIDCEEFLGHHIHMHLLEGSYCCRVLNMRLHQIIQRNLINRWLHPIVPEAIDEFQLFNSITSIDSNHANRQIGKYNLRQNAVYIHSTSDVAQISTIGDNTIIGPQSKISKSSQVANSTIGESCQISTNSSIKGSTLMNNVKVGKGSEIINSIICNNVVIGDNVIIKQGCVLCDDVRVSDDMNIGSNKIIYMYRNKSMVENKKEVETDKYSFSVVGKDGAGFIWDGNVIEEVDSDEDSDKMSLDSVEPIEDCISKIWGMKLDDYDKSDWNVASNNDDDDEDDDGEIIQDINDEYDEFSEDDSDEFTDNDLIRFQTEVIETINRRFKDNIDWDNLHLEINGSKHANNVSLENLVKTLTTSLLTICLQKKTSGDSRNFYKIYEELTEDSLPLFANYIRDDNDESMTLEVYEKFAQSHESVMASLLKIFLLLYKKDIISESVMIEWYDRNPTDVVRTKVKQVVEWLKNAEEESDEESSSDDDE